MLQLAPLYVFYFQTHSEKQHKSQRRPVIERKVAVICDVLDSNEDNEDCDDNEMDDVVRNAKSEEELIASASGMFKKSSKFNRYKSATPPKVIRDSDSCTEIEPSTASSSSPQHRKISAPSSATPLPVIPMVNETVITVFSSTDSDDNIADIGNQQRPQVFSRPSKIAEEANGMHHLYS